MEKGNKQKLFDVSFYFAAMILFYHLFRFVYFGSIHLAARWNRKAEMWVKGRNEWKEKLQQQWKLKQGEKAVWMHCASLGEFEQGRPLLEAIKKQYPDCKILLTFFSPSGYEIQKDYKGADLIIYLPEDGPGNATAFLNIVQPSLAVFVKYEFWHYYLAELKKRNKTTILVSGIFRNTQPFFQWWGGFYRKMLFQFSHLFVQNEESARLLASINIHKNVSVCGDTRFDRVLELAEHWQPVPPITSFLQPNKKILIAGSTWQEDEALIAQWFHMNQKDWQLLIAPHEIDSAHVQQLEQLFSNSVRFTQLRPDQELPANCNCIIIDSIGHLSKLYKYGTICYVGGGFTKDGIHNTLEAAVYNKAVVTGPNIRKYREAVEMKETGGLFAISSYNELETLVHTIDLSEAGKKAGAYVQENAGATAAIINYIQEKRLFTSA